MDNERRKDDLLSAGESDVDAQHDEFVQSLRELMGWYGKSVKDVVAILKAEPSLGDQGSIVNVPQSIH